MNKFLFFRTATDDGALMPVESLDSFEINFNSTEVDLRFNDPASLYVAKTITLNVATDTARPVIDAISKAIKENSDPFIIIADDVDKQYVHENVTSVDSISL
jgi:hypothetical protein